MNGLELYSDKKDFPETMTVKQVAGILQLDPRTIQVKVKELFPGIIQERKTTYLNEEQVTAVKLSCEKKFAVKTDLEKELIIQQAAMFQAEKIETLKQLNGLLVEENKALIKENEVLIPKSQFYDQVTGSKDAIDIGSVAKVLNVKGIGRNKLFQILRDKKVFQGNNLPYQNYIDRGYFRTIEQSYQKPDGSTHINIKTVVYQKGLDYIRKVLK